MLRSTLVAAACLGISCLGFAPVAEAGAFDFKKMRKKLERSVEKRADEIGDASRKLGRKVEGSKVVTKTKAAAEETGKQVSKGAKAVADTTKKGAQAVGEAARSARDRIRFGFHGRCKAQPASACAAPTPAGAEVPAPATPCPPQAPRICPPAPPKLCPPSAPC